MVVFVVELLFKEKWSCIIKIKENGYIYLLVIMIFSYFDFKNLFIKYNEKKFGYWFIGKGKKVKFMF